MLIIAPRNAHQEIINYYRKDNPFFDVKVIDKSDLLKAVGYLYKSDTVIYMMAHYHYSYDEAETYLSLLQYDFEDINPKLHKLKELQKELIEAGYLYKSEASKYLYLKKPALVIGYSKDDTELIHLSNLLDMKLEFFTYPSKINITEFNCFSRLEDEVYYVLNEISHDIDKGRDINDIYIFNRSEEYLYYLKSFSPLFGFHINFPNSSSVKKTGVYVDFKKLYEETHNLDESLLELEKICLNDDYYHQFVDAINHIRIDNLPYEIESIYLDKKLASSYLEQDYYLDAVNIISEPTLFKNKKVYVLGFVQGQFPRSKKDDSFLNEDELVKLHLLTNKLYTRIDQECLLNFLRSENEFVVSYSKKSLENTLMFVSPLNEYFSIKANTNPFKDYFYSKEALRYIVCNLKDLNTLYNVSSSLLLTSEKIIKDEYRSYDNSFKGANVYKNDDRLRLSTTRLSDYYNCPFKYYVGNILKVDPFEETIESIFGKIVHELLEKSLLDESYDVSEHYDKLIDESNVPVEMKILWSLTLKEQIVNMVKYVKLHNRYMKNPSFAVEKNITVNLDQHTLLNGKIDKLITLDNKYLIMVDYKTGSSGDFEERYLKEGLSSQLPTYALLAKESKEYSKYTVSGLYINHIYSKKNETAVKEDELVPAYLKLKGKALNDYASFFAFDSTIASGKSSFVYSVKMKEETLVSSSSIVDKDKLDEYIEIVRQKYLEASELIRGNKFNIYPSDKGTGKGRACQYCSFRDICYLRESQVHYLSNEEEEIDS